MNLSLNDIKTFAKDLLDNNNLRMFEIKDENGEAFIRAVNVFNTSVVVHDFIYNEKCINYNEDEISAVEKYEITIPLMLYKLCAVKDNRFILSNNLLRKMKELEPVSFASIRPIRWFIRNYPVEEIKSKLKVLHEIA